MTSGERYRFLMFVGMLLMATAVYWSLGGSDRAASEMRTAAVIAQIVVGLVVTLWAWRRQRKPAASP